MFAKTPHATAFLPVFLFRNQNEFASMAANIVSFGAVPYREEFFASL
jgi:hypothetical protein